MKFLQLNINSLNTSTEELWDYQEENNCEGIFLQETNYTAGKTSSIGRQRCIQYKEIKIVVLEWQHSSQHL